MGEIYYKVIGGNFLEMLYILIVVVDTQLHTLDKTYRCVNLWYIIRLQKS